MSAASERSATMPPDIRQARARANGERLQVGQQRQRVYDEEGGGRIVPGVEIGRTGLCDSLFQREKRVRFINRQTVTVEQSVGRCPESQGNRCQQAGPWDQRSRFRSTPMSSPRPYRQSEPSSTRLLGLASAMARPTVAREMPATCGCRLRMRRQDRFPAFFGHSTVSIWPYFIRRWRTGIPRNPFLRLI